jgi:hypothetical protein
MKTPDIDAKDGVQALRDAAEQASEDGNEELAQDLLDTAAELEKGDDEEEEGA